MYSLQSFLNNAGTLDDLRVKYAINATRHKTYPNLVLLKYNQLESPFAEPMVREARGLILDEAANWSPVCARFSKFFNYGESHAAQIDWKTARVQEKVDGSLVTIYYYDDKWHVATSGSPDASGRVGEYSFTFAELFWKTFNEMGLRLPNNPQLCLSFELTSRFNRVIVPHKEARLTLIGAHRRDIPDQRNNEIAVETVSGYPVVKSYKLSSFEDIVLSFKNIDPLSQEGYVVVDGNYNRVKIKHPGYVALHHLKDGFGPRRIVEIIRASEKPEVLTYFPEWTEQFNDSQNRYDRLVQETIDLYEKIKDIPVQKDFALAVQAHRPAVPAALYRLRAGQIDSVKQHLADMPIQALMKILGLRDTNKNDSQAISIA